MNTSADLLLRILNAFLYQKRLDAEAVQQIQKQADDVLYLAKQHNVLGITGYKIREYYALYEPEKAEERELLSLAEQMYSLTVQRTVNRELRCRNLFLKLEEEGIDFIPFKGIVVRNFYAVPELRTFGDIDFIIRREDRERCHALMLSWGYQSQVDFGEVYSYLKDCEHYEIHTSIMTINITENGAQKEYFTRLWEYAEREKAHLWRLTPEFHFLYLVAHIAKHIYGSGAGIRMYLDLAFLLKAEGKRLNWDWIKAEAEKLGLEKFFLLTLFCLQKWFGIQLPFSLRNPEPKVAAQFFDFTMEAGIFGKEGNRESEAVLRQAHGQKKGFVRTRALCRILFPSAAVIRDKYGYLKKHPYLLPAAWIDRCLRNRKRIKRKIEESGEILLTKKENIKRNTEFYHKIGL